MKELKTWLLELMLKTMNSDNVPENIKEELIALSPVDITLTKIVDENPRALFDFFDEHNIYIEIRIDTEFTYVIHAPIGTNTVNETFETRLLAEKSAIQEAFKILETQLKPEEDDRQDSTTSSSEIPE